MYKMKTHSQSFGGVRGSPIFNMQEKKSHGFQMDITLKGCKTMRCLKLCVCLRVCVCMYVFVFRGFYKQLFFFIKHTLVYNLSL